jgi:hypothetical protein
MQGTVTELETVGNALSAGGHYIIRHHKVADEQQAVLDVSASDAITWKGFHFQPGQWSFIKIGKVCC